MRSVEFSIVVKLGYERTLMADIKDVAHDLAKKAIGRFSAMEHREKLQLHRARVLDANSRAFWDLVVAELTAGIAEYDSAIRESPFAQEHTITRQADSVQITWRYPIPQSMQVSFQFEQRRIVAIKRNTTSHGAARMDVLIAVDEEDHLFASPAPTGEPIGDPSDLAKELLTMMTSGSF
jgi:hypothetical protein